MDKLTFINELKSKGLNLTPSMIDKFAIYYYFLVTENTKYNLTNITLETEVYEKHFYDSLSLLFPNPLNGSVLDVGSGGGFPSMPLKIVNPDLNLSILDSTERKMKFVDDLSEKLGLKVRTICARAEEFNETFDYVVARGVAPLPILLEICANLVKKDGVLIAMKGSKYQDELKASENACKVLGFELVQEYSYSLPNEGSKRCNLYFKKTRSHGLKYPRNYAKIKKNPL